MANATHLQELFNKYLLRQSSPAELKELGVLLQQAGSEEELSPQMIALWNKIKDVGINYPVDWDTMYEHISGIDKAPVIPISRSKRIWYRVAVAASIILAIGVGSYFLFFNKSATQNEIVKKQETHDIQAPNVARATLKLNDGTIVYLDSAKNGSLAVQGKINIVKLADGQIVYSASSEVSPKGGDLEGAYNTLYNPRGSKVVSIILNDGSKVWLNSESSLKYPTAFVGKERKVEITGEAYFEVAHNAGSPFKVSKGETVVEVLGTHFNVNAYDDEDTIKVTLLEGKVKVNKGNNTQLLVPGQQAKINSSGKIAITCNIDINEITAWKDNRFYFMSADIKTIMRQLARWYDVDVLYKDEITNHFTGIISRNVNASEVFSILEQTGAVHFNIEGKKIIVRK